MVMNSFKILLELECQLFLFLGISGPDWEQLCRRCSWGAGSLLPAVLCLFQLGTPLFPTSFFTHQLFYIQPSILMLPALPHFPPPVLNFLSVLFLLLFSSTRVESSFKTQPSSKPLPNLLSTSYTLKKQNKTKQ